jgi:putative membrane protein
VAIVIMTGLEKHQLISGVFSLLGLILSIILVFRTNTAYDRWYEGRRQWGTLVNHSRNLAIQIDACFPAEDRDSRAEFARLIANFAFALRDHLRGDAKPEALIPPACHDVDGDEVTDIPGSVGHLPARVARAIVTHIHQARRDGAIDGFDILSLKPHTQALLDVAGACERIRKTPIPFSYSVFIKLFITCYALILPVGLAPEYGSLAVPLTMLIVFALLGVELMAEEIEEPFGLDCNDLPIGTIAEGIRSDVAELLGVTAAPTEPAVEPYSKIF